jgi:hypothetical protein
LAASIDFGCGAAVEPQGDCRDAAVLDADVGVRPLGGAAQARTADRNIERLSIHLGGARRRHP